MPDRPYTVLDQLKTQRDAAVEEPETDEQRADREETERDHAAGDHTYCGITCETELPTEHLRNFVIAKGYPGTKGALDELLRRAAANPTHEARQEPTQDGETQCSSQCSEQHTYMGGCALKSSAMDPVHILGIEADEETPQPTAEEITTMLADATDPTHLRWGLDDVLWGDDDSVTVLLSGPDREPYWLELDPERAAVLRRNLAGPDGETQQPEAEAQAYPPETSWQIETQWHTGDWRSWALGTEHEEALYEFERVEDGKHAWRLVRFDTTTAVEAEHTPPAVGAQQPKEADGDRIVAYRSALPGALSVYCTNHTDELGGGVMPLTSDDLPDGGVCAGCGIDVLIPQQPKEAESPRTVCVCDHTKGEHITVSGRLLCDTCDPDSTENLTCTGFEAL